MAGLSRRNTRGRSSISENCPTDLSPKALAFEKLASDYDAWFDREGKLVFDIEVRAFQEILSLLPKPWLEIGVGSGRFARALGIETGIDPSIELLNIAKCRGINTIQGKGEEAIFKEGAFSTVFLIVTLCFVDSPEAVLREAQRILTPDGKVVLGLVLKESPWGKFYGRKKQEGHRFYRYATFFSRDEVVGLLAKAGFTAGRVISTLFQPPDEVHLMEEPRQGYSPDAGFTIIVGTKRNREMR
jgi:SAM-dependent methyltransferase